MQPKIYIYIYSIMKTEDI